VSVPIESSMVISTSDIDTSPCRIGRVEGCRAGS
jgi:hypothetical protein